MALFVYSVSAYRLKFKGSKKLLEHWRKTHEKLPKLYTCTNCKKTFSSLSKAATHLCQAGSQHWSKEIEVRNKNSMDPWQARLNQHTKELSPREVAAEERKLLPLEQKFYITVLESLLIGMRKSLCLRMEALHATTEGVREKAISVVSCRTHRPLL